MEDLEGPTKKSIARGKSERFLKSLINDAIKVNDTYNDNFSENLLSPDPFWLLLLIRTL